MKRLLLLISLLLCVGRASAALDPVVMQGLASDDFDGKQAAVAALAAAGDDADAQRLLKALSEDAVAVAGGRLVIVAGEQVLDPASGAPIKPAPASPESISLNNSLRQQVDGALAAVRLLSADRGERLTAARALLADMGEGAALLPLFDKALAREQDGEIKPFLVQLAAQAALGSPDVARRLQAVRDLAGSGSPAVKALLLPLLDPANEPEEKLRLEAGTAIKAIDARLAWSDTAGQIFTGISLGSILLLAALGLAITYGVMGVINMAHGELLMVGAYSAYTMQALFRAKFPEFVDYYLLAAVPVAFFVAAAVGMLMERTVIRHLYGRPLETLLATWGLSLVLIQAARLLFGAQNVEVANPVWMSGGVQLAENLSLPWNRLIIVAFSGFVLLLVWLMMNKTRLGMFVRAVTQNRPMAGCVGVPTARIDTLAFGIGSGIAGLGGVALSQIANVGPDMGQGYIVDSFMVVVLGGVGQLAGAVWAALGLGVVTKFLEGWAGAVIAKILVLVFIIIFIQKRPQGLFALKGRFVD
ncbi:urea ABC transporter permease subunit UrtB [Zoogloea sp.]|uniref:urea ABC transporter permease subunit UrtB n=1 Tax=Zoogloea sp. TaxID=49181 RepID=UPI002C56FE35|nr:urea ABC transporter permease subunit UrtB [Zoogloea sp.]HOY02862.1 urea ABC transporter permease subunit UrtB [Zoogloea sp.]HPI61076.1 urea ABC transporter permease subunit UrtB [Zoogloea sp.]